MQSVHFPADGWISNPECKMAWRALYGPARLLGIEATYSIAASGEVLITLSEAPAEILSEFKQLCGALFPWLDLTIAPLGGGELALMGVINSALIKPVLLITAPVNA